MGDPWYHDAEHVRFLLQLAVAHEFAGEDDDADISSASLED